LKIALGSECNSFETGHLWWPVKLDEQNTMHQEMKTDAGNTHMDAGSIGAERVELGSGRGHEDDFRELEME
jgi:hypothetical protein